MIKLIIAIFFLMLGKSIAQMDSAKSYYDNGNIKSCIHYTDNIRDGLALFYWENGNIKEELTYLNGKVDGLVKRYDENGILREMFTIENGKREGPTSLFDSTGTFKEDIYYTEGILDVDKIVLDKGDYESILASYERRKKQWEEKKKELSSDNPLPPKIEEEHDYSDDPAFYKTVEVMPKPIGSMEAIYRKISYPKEARENKIEGTVKILVFIDRDGEVLDAQVLNGIGYGCDESARLAVFYHRFTPGMIRGQKVKVQMEIPIEFKLNKEDE